MRNITWVACLVALLACGDPTDQVSAGDTDPILDRYGAGSLFGCWQFEFDQGEGESQVWPVRSSRPIATRWLGCGATRLT